MKKQQLILIAVLGLAPSLLAAKDSGPRTEFTTLAEAAGTVSIATAMAKQARGAAKPAIGSRSRHASVYYEAPTNFDIKKLSPQELWSLTHESRHACVTNIEHKPTQDIFANEVELWLTKTALDQIALTANALIKANHRFAKRLEQLANRYNRAHDQLHTILSNKTIKIADVLLADIYLLFWHTFKIKDGRVKISFLAQDGLVWAIEGIMQKVLTQLGVVETGACDLYFNLLCEDACPTHEDAALKANMVARWTYQTPAGISRPTGPTGTGAGAGSGSGGGSEQGALPGQIVSPEHHKPLTPRTSRASSSSNTPPSPGRSH